MLERYLTENLTKHFGHFVENLDSDQVRLSAWKGEIHLQNLQIRRHALDSLFAGQTAPVEIAHGKVGNLQVSIPWTVLRSQLTWRSRHATAVGTSSSSPVVSIVLTDVNLLITPRRYDDASSSSPPPSKDSNKNDNGNNQQTKEQDEDDVETSTHDDAAREQEIQAALDAELLKRVAESTADTRTDEEKKSWIKDRLTSLLENLSVTVRNIHIRYEDTGHSMGFQWRTDVSKAMSAGSAFPAFSTTTPPIHRYRPSFCVGITLKEFSIRASDAPMEGEGREPKTPTSKQQSQDKAEPQSKIRVISTEALAIYWDSDTPVMSEVAVQKATTGNEFFEAAFESLQSDDRTRGWTPRGGFAPKHSFVLDPFSPSITLCLVRNPSDMDVAVEDTPRQPSTLKGYLPPCRFALSRNLLEDLGYLRKSYAVWKQSNAGHISEATLRHLAGLRPKRSPLENPRGWWHYVIEATIAVNREEAARDGRELVRGDKKLRSGWLGVGRLLALRKKYVASYQTLLQAEANEDRSTAHRELVALENKLEMQEVVAFRIHTYSWLRDRGVVRDTASDEAKTQHLGRWRWTVRGSSSVVDDDDTKIAISTTSNVDAIDGVDKGTAERTRSFYEMSQALDREKANTTIKEREDDEIEKQDLAYGLGNPLNPAIWKADLSCAEVSLQVNDRRIVHRHRDKPAPVVRLSCAFSQEQRIYRDGSWEYQLGVGSLKVKDCTHLRSKGSASRNFPYLVGPKRGYAFEENDRIVVDGIAYDQIVRLNISRSQHAFRSTVLGSTTVSSVRVLPLEICYLTSPVEALSRILNTANIDFADDYQRLSSSLFAWRERQKKRLLAALSQQNKQIVVNVDLWAPTVYIPESEENASPVLLVDLGHLAFSNDSNKSTHFSSSADHWRLSVSQIQVQCTSVASVTRRQPVTRETFQQVVEPFSLNFAVSTSFHRHENDDSLAYVQDQILVVATLPRLVFNLNASVVRLLKRLQSQWNERKLEIQSSLLLPSRVFGSLAGRQQAWRSASLSKTQPPTSGDRIFQFRFVAPLLRLQFENDVDGRDCYVDDETGERTATPILDLSVRGIEGEVQNERLKNGLVRHSFQAKMRSIDAKDLYQRGGSRFSWLMSSISPDTMGGVLDDRDAFSSVTDLVSIRYTSSDHPNATGKEAESDHGSNRLSIRFHELFVEWNPDTIAAINYAVKASPDPVIPEDKSSDAGDDVFFDAEEDEFLEVGSIESDEDDSSTDLISEISSHPSSFANLTELSTNFQFNLLPTSLMYSAPRSMLGAWSQLNPVAAPAPSVEKSKKLEIEFVLSKLRIHFNKETRRRRVFIAEVDHTSVSYSTRLEGGYKAKISLGNLTLADPQSDFDGTLYREIMGLKADTIKSSENSSLLEMTLVKNPRVRRFADGEDWSRNGSDAMDEHVAVDLSQGVVRGCDMFFSASLSPMRFVYLQQLWFEIVDYLFEGLLGFEVWGNVRPNPGSLGRTLNDQAHAEAVTYTKFEISMQSPIILIPVTYCSTDFVRFETDSIFISNFYNYRPARRDGSGGGFDEAMLQWFNNCSVTMNRITLSSWSGNALNNTYDTVNCEICIDWPTGPLAVGNKPKWKVSVAFDELRLSFLKEDYALLQHIIASNISEPSRHLDEWNCLQNLPIEIREAFEREAFVVFGYDKKDVTPSTFDVTLSIPLLLFGLRESGEGQIAVAQCKDVVWGYKKCSDLISRQHVSLDINLVGSDGDSERMMLSSHDIWSSGGDDVPLPNLVYTSTTTPAGDNNKVLAIGDGCIHVGYKPWRRFTDFFSQLPTPSFLSPSEVIQVGDRWYKISGGNARDAIGQHGPSNDWIMELGASSTIDSPSKLTRRDPTFTFKLELRRPRIALKATDSALLLAMENISLHQSSKSGLMDREVKLSGVELQTMSQHDPTTGRHASLISPLNIEAEMHHCSGTKPCTCSNHSTSVKVQKLNASAAFSDLVRLSLVLFQLKADYNDIPATSAKSSKPVPELDKTIHHTSDTALDLLLPESTMSVDCEGVGFSLVDDSGRHFADAQELLLFTMRRITYLAVARKSMEIPGQTEKSTTLGFEDLCIHDTLQSAVSPFRTVLFVSAGDSYDSLLSSAQASSLNLVGGDVERGIEISQVVTSDLSNYMLGIHSVEMQYNPSMVVALQRFLGRLFKTINKKMRPRREMMGSIRRPETVFSAPKSKKTAIEAVAVLKTAAVSLNKEHQGRCLLNLTLTDIHLSAEQNQQVARLKGKVGFFSATDANEYDSLLYAIQQDNRPIVKMRNGKNRFLEFEYSSFRTKLLPENSNSYGLPTWVLNYTQEQLSDIDDYLDLSVASVEIVYLSSRSKELIDYLSNGLPGKGMGATSRAAKGFVAERIQKKSFLQVNVDAPVFLVPRSESETVGLVFGGEVRTRSWIEASDATRKLFLSVGRLYGGVYSDRFHQTHKPILSNVDVAVHVSRDTSDNTSAVCNLSDLFARLSYSDYFVSRNYSDINFAVLGNLVLISPFVFPERGASCA
eukprot:scaffold2704_cov159-Amphora_coffeaeformis.AAC.9